MTHPSTTHLPVLLLAAALGCGDTSTPSPPEAQTPTQGTPHPQGRQGGPGAPHHARGGGPQGPPPGQARPGKNGPPGPPPGGQGAPQEGQRDQGQQHPPLPAHNPVWDWDAGGFVSEHGWYGEHSWADVRMRVAGHISIAGRDLARIAAEAGDYAGCAAAYTDLSTRLTAIALPDEGVARDIGTHLQAAAARDAAVCGALAKGEAPPQGTGQLGPLRARYLALAQGGADPEAARALQAALVPHLELRADLDLDAFEDFNARHRLRVRLFEAYLDALDPIGLDERWGYWEPVELRRQALALGVAAATLGGDDWSSRLGDMGPAPDLSRVSPVARPSHVAAALRDTDQAAAFTVTGLGALPTGDSLIDVGAQPGPRAIGTLEKLGLEDAEHKAWLTDQATQLNKLLESDPPGALAGIRSAAATLDAHTHGSRYYNVKQVRNEGIRQLARAGRADLALSLLADQFPLHHQDWACPNREGILLAIEGRLLAEAGKPDQARAKLKAALDAADAFLANVDAAEEAGPGRGPGQRPPQMGPQR